MQRVFRRSQTSGTGERREQLHIVQQRRLDPRRVLALQLHLQQQFPLADELPCERFKFVSARSP
jgi:hypothetical protein